MKRFRSSEDFDSYGEKGDTKDLGGRRDEETAQQRPSSSSTQRSSYSYYKPSESGRKLITSPRSRYDEERDTSRLVRKRSNYDLDSYDRRKSYDRQRDAAHERVNFGQSPRAGYDAHRIPRSESFSGPRRDFPKGFRSERDRPRRDNFVASWRRLGGGKDFDEGAKSANEPIRGSRMESEDVSGRVKSPVRQRDVRSSSAMSKESESERSKSVDGKGKVEDSNNNNTIVESFVPHSNEREEGELEPEPQPLAKPTIKDGVDTLSQEKLSSENPVERKDAMDSSNAEKGESSMKLEANINGGLDERQGVAVDGASKSGDEDDDDDVNEEKEGSNNVVEGRGEGSFEEDEEGTSAADKGKEESNTNIVTKKEGLSLIPNVAEAEPSMEEVARNLIDKGKRVVLTVSPSSSPNHIGMDFVAEAEGPSTMGFQFFSNDPIKKENVEQLAPRKPKDDKMGGALELSLSLPNVLLPIGAQAGEQGPSSPSHGRSIQSFASSFRTNSNGFTASMSFSGSQQITHNPSCSMNHEMYDYEKSVGSKPLFKGVDWKALAAASEEPAFPRLPPQASKANSPGQAMANGQKITADGLERQLSFGKKTHGSQGFVSYRNGSEKMKLIVEEDSNGTDFPESIVTMIAAEPMHLMARRFGEMNPQQISLVKEHVQEIISQPSKKWQLSALQKALQNRDDITMDALLSARRFQLEILTALKTGMGDFVLTRLDVPSSELAEIFLTMRCKNPMCRSVLPVDDCDCKICARQRDFCRECMCLVCAKFDNGANTCGWVGCDVCLHWCHADCGLRESHIRNGLSAKGMQFYCVACDHPSEMFGFVKEVFQNFVKAWDLDSLRRELEYVRRIFEGSADVRGKRLHEFSVRMMLRLNGGVEIDEATKHILNFFNEIDSDKHGTPATEPRKELPAKIDESNNNVIGLSSHVWGKHIGRDPQSSLDEKLETKSKLDFRRTVVEREQPVYDELDSIVRIKQAEANMYQLRAYDARKECEALKRISASKSEKVEEEYRRRIDKLRLAEAEDMRRQKVEELQAVERSYQEYFSMKMRMEMEIKDLLLKMESTRRNLTM